MLAAAHNPDRSKLTTAWLLVQLKVSEKLSSTKKNNLAKFAKETLRSKKDRSDTKKTTTTISDQA